MRFARACQYLFNGRRGAFQMIDIKALMQIVLRRLRNDP
jgi:hypothetical protein